MPKFNSNARTKVALVDVPYLSHASLHSNVGRLNNGVIFGVLRSLEKIADRFPDHKIVCCWDHPRLFRKEIYPEYKANRKPVPGLDMDEFNRQRTLLRTEILPRLFQTECVEGYEADDIIAHFCFSLPNPCTVISSDEDLYQLLGPRVRQYLPLKKEFVTQATFESEYGVHPRQWSTVKAIAGCSGDNVKGIAGIGEKRACMYLNGTLNAKWSAPIERGIATIIKRNLILVDLPLKPVDKSRQLPKAKLDNTEFSASEWKAISVEFGMKTIVKGVKRGK